MKPEVNLFTDGACLTATGRGGWGSWMTCGNTGIVLFGHDVETTNNRMELFSVIAGLAQLTVPCNVNVYSDSQYVVNAIMKGWLTSWIKNGWKTSEKKPVSNQDLWQLLIPYLQVHTVKANWVKGHNGHFENEVCDEIASYEAHKPL